MSNRIRSEDIPVPVIELCRTLARHGHRGWVVGGCLRDLLRGEQPADWDLATSARPNEVQGIFPRVLPTGIQHGTVTVRHRGVGYELTTLRGEGAYSDGRRPDSVHFVTDIHEDLARRDFTINAIAYDPVADRLEDPFAGLVDLDARILRAVGDPARRFGEDGLRVLRAARFAATLEFALEPATEAAIEPSLDTFRRVSAERVRDEWMKALRARAPSRALDVMRRTGILAVTSPGLAALSDEAWASACAAVDTAPADPCMRLAALLWPLRDELAEIDAWLARYRFSNAERERIGRMLRHAAPAELAGGSEGDVRRYARAVGREHLEEVASLASIVTRAYDGEASAAHRDARALGERLATLVTLGTPLTARDLAIGGRELMQEVDLPPGPALGKLLEALLELVLENPALNERERLIEMARVLRAAVRVEE